MTSMQDPHPNSGTGFLSLPAELRNLIYSLSLIRGIFCVYTFRGRPWSTVFGVYEPVEIPVGLLQANRQILAEAGPILYGANKFIFPDTNNYWNDLERWLEQIGTRNCRMVRELGMFPPDAASPETKRHTITMIRCGELLGTMIDLKLFFESLNFMVNEVNGSKIRCLGIVWKNREQIPGKTSKGKQKQKALRA